MGVGPSVGEMGPRMDGRTDRARARHGGRGMGGITSGSSGEERPQR